MAIEAQCFADCGDDFTCFNGCVERFEVCRSNCPCYDLCPEGCDGCMSVYCTCSDLSTNKDFQHCNNIEEAQFHICLAACHPDDTDCFSDCSRAYDEALKHCPCQVLQFSSCMVQNFRRNIASVVVLVKKVITLAVMVMTTKHRS